MATKRCFTPKIVESDAFLDMPLSAQCLYFHLNFHADDDGFVNSAKRVMRLIGASDDDLKLLIMKSFVLVFESGVIVIKHYRMHNTLMNDRYRPTDYQEEFAQLGLKKNNSYTWKQNGNILETEWKQNGNKMETEHNITEHNITEHNKDIDALPSKKEVKHHFGSYNHVLLTDSELKRLKADYPNWEILIEYLDEYIEMKGYKAKSHYLAIKKWVVNAVEERKWKDARYQRISETITDEEEAVQPIKEEMPDMTSEEVLEALKS